MCSKHVEAWNKLIIKFSASSWLVLRNKYTEMHGQQNIKTFSLYAVSYTLENVTVTRVMTYCSSWYSLTLKLKLVRRILTSVDCGILHVGLLDVLVSFDCEQKPLGLQSLVVLSCNFFLYECKKVQWSSYKNFNCTVLLMVPYRSPSEIYFAL